MFRAARDTLGTDTLCTPILWGFIQNPAGEGGKIPWEGSLGRFPLALVGFGGGQHCLGGHAATNLPPRSSKANSSWFRAWEKTFLVNKELPWGEGDFRLCSPFQVCPISNTPCELSRGSISC